MEMEEIWKDIPFILNYKVSNLGNVKSKDRLLIRSCGKKHVVKSKILKQIINNNYLRVCINGKPEYVHQLVARAFKNHITDGTHEKVIDHIDGNKLNNNADNLQILNNRENCSKEPRGVSKYTGVSWIKSRKRWNSQISINGKQIFIGRFKNEYEAHLAYQKKLKEINQ